MELTRVKCCYNCNHRDKKESRHCNYHNISTTWIDGVCSNHEIDLHREITRELEDSLRRFTSALNNTDTSLEIRLGGESVSVVRDWNEPSNYVKLTAKGGRVKKEVRKFTTKNFLKDIVSGILECEIQRSEIELIRLGIEKINKWIAER